MDDHLDLLARGTEKPMRFDDFETLVHHRRRIDRDLAPHAPAWMGTGLIGRHADQLTHRRGAEGTARSSQQDPAYAALFGHARVASRQTLEDRVVLAVDRQQGCAAFPHSRHEHPAGEHQRLLVGEQNALARARRSHRRSEPRPAYDRGDDGIDFRQCRGFPQALGAGEHPRRQALPAHRRGQLARRIRVQQRGKLRPETGDHFEQSFPLPVRRQRRHGESLRVLCDDVQRRCADRSGRA